MLPSWQTGEHIVLHRLSYPQLLSTTSLDSFRILQFKDLLPSSAVLHGMKYKNSANDNFFIHGIILLFRVAHNHVINLTDLIAMSV